MMVQVCKANFDTVRRWAAVEHDKVVTDVVFFEKEIGKEMRKRQAAHPLIRWLSVNPYPSSRLLRLRLAKAVELRDATWDIVGKVDTAQRLGADFIYLSNAELSLLL